MSEVQKAVRERYAAAATRLSEGDGSSSADSGCSPGSAGSCCSPGDATAISLSTGYSTQDLVQIGLSGAVIREAYRVLKPGGRLAVADMVEVEALAPHVKSAADAWAGCIAGTIPVADYRRLLVSAGFADPDIEVHQVTELPEGGRIGSAYIRAVKPTTA